MTAHDVNIAFSHARATRSITSDELGWITRTLTELRRMALVGPVTLVVRTFGESVSFDLVGSSDACERGQAAIDQANRAIFGPAVAV